MQLMWTIKNAFKRNHDAQGMGILNQNVFYVGGL
jgi:hypothetical protein